MQINYIILTHKSPAQLERLISRLDDENASFFVHIDAKTDIEPFRYLEKDNVIFLDNRVDVIWGDFSIVQATLNAMQRVAEHQNQGYTILLSGQDYPIKSKREINEYLSQNQDFDFINYVRVDKAWKKYRLRTVARKINFSSRGKYAAIFSVFDVRSLRDFYMFWHSILKFIYFSSLKNYPKMFSYLFKKRKVPIAVQYGGSAWWALRHSTVTKILNLIDERKDIIAYYKECLLPDEMIFQTLIHLIPDYDGQTKDTINYANWDRKEKPLPVIFDVKDLDELLQQPPHKLFARKFDIEQKGTAILDSLDKLTD